MNSISKITKENFQSMFNIKDILDGSVYYPASGIDASDIECLSEEYCSFVHVDYSTPIEVVEPGMMYHFEGVGYDLIGIKHLTKEDLTPNGFSQQTFSLNEHERERLKNSFINDKFYGRNFNHFALWAVYELNPSKTNRAHGKAQRFSLLHIGGEACATFEALYIGNKINPHAIVIINPGEGYGDNWTIFSNPNYRFFRNLELNSSSNNIKMPSVLLSNMMKNDTNKSLWPNYCFNKRHFTNDWLIKYIKMNDLVLVLENGNRIIVSEQDLPDTLLWEDAHKAINALGEGWRLPTIFELQQIFNQRERLNFGNVGYWSYLSSDEGKDINTIHVFSGPEGNIILSQIEKREKFYIRPVKSIL